MVSELLYNVGLTVNESKIYNFLVENGLTTVLKLSRLLRISRSGVYASLASLREKSLVVYDKNTNSWAALEFDDFAETLITDIKYLKLKLSAVCKKSNAFNLILETNIIKNKLLFYKLISDSKRVKTVMIGSKESLTNKFLNNVELRNLTVLSDQELPFKVKESNIFRNGFFYDRMITLIIENKVYLFLDDFKFLVKLNDIDLVNSIFRIYSNN